MHRVLAESIGDECQKADSVGSTRGTGTTKQGKIAGRLEMWSGKGWMNM